MLGRASLGVDGATACESSVFSDAYSMVEKERPHGRDNANARRYGRERSCSERRARERGATMQTLIPLSPYQTMD